MLTLLTSGYYQGTVNPPHVPISQSFQLYTHPQPAPSVYSSSTYTCPLCWAQVRHFFRSITNTAHTVVGYVTCMCTQALVLVLTPILITEPRSNISSGPITNTAHTVVDYVMHTCTLALVLVFMPILITELRLNISSGPITNTAHTVVGYVGLHYAAHMCIWALMLILMLILTIKPGSNISSSLITNIVHAVVG